jgi:hypothetical protein
MKAKGALPFVILVGAAALFFREALFTEQTFYFRDITSFFHPTRRLISELVREGHLPLWNPYVLSGFPLAADVVNNVFYPLSALYYLLPFDTGFKWFIVCHYPIAGICWYLLGREWGLPRGAALFGGIAFMLSGPLLSLTNAINFLPGIAWLPLTLLGFHRALLRRSWRSAAWTSLILALQALGDPLMVYFTLIVMGLYGLTMLRPSWTKSILTTFGALGGIALLAALVAAVQLVPLAELYRESIRAGGMRFEETIQRDPGLHRLLELVFPRLFGDPALETYWIGMARGRAFTPWLLSPYLGVTTLVLALFGLLTRWRERLVWFLAVLLGISGALALGAATPVHGLAFKLLPFYAVFRYTEKWWIVVAFAMAGLAGVGLAALFELKSTLCRRFVAVLGAVLAVGILLAALFVSRSPDLVKEWLTPVFRADNLDVIISLVGHRVASEGLITAGLLLATTFCLVAAERPRIPKIAVMVFVLLLLLMDLTLRQNRLAPLTTPLLHRDPSPIVGVFSGETQPFRSTSIHTDWSLAAGAIVKERPTGVEYHRWLVKSLYPNTGLRYRLYTEAGLGSVLLKDYEALAARVGKARSVDHWSLWNVKYVLSLREMTSPSFEPVPVPNSNPPVRLYRNRDVLPRAWVVPRARRFASRERILSHMTEGGFDPRQEVLLEGKADGVETTDPGPWRAAIIRQEPNEIVIDVSTERGGYLVLSETFYPGWRVRADGSERPLLRANYAMRAVRLEPGAHRVRVFFSPLSVWTGAGISLGTLLGLLIVIVVRRGDTFGQSC